MGILILSVFMVMITFFLHAFFLLFFHCIHTVRQFQCLSAIIWHGLQDILHPCIIFSSDINEQVTVLDRYDILGCRLIRMGFLARLQ